MNKFRFRVKKIKLKSIYQKLDNGIVLNGILTAPKHGYALQRKRNGLFGIFSFWEHIFWTKKDHSHLNFLLTDA